MFRKNTGKAALLLLAAMLLAGTGAAAQEEVLITLADSGVLVDGESAKTGAGSAVYVAQDIVFYPEGKDFTFGEGTQEDAHAQQEADAHTVVHIAQPGTYRLSGTLSAGQIAVDLGEGAKEDESAVVTLILDGANVTSTVAPALIFYNVYECAQSDPDTATKDVDTAAAGANVVIADGSVNHFNGSYVARIYESVELSEDGKEILSSEKLHKYDGAFYSRRSMNVTGGEKGDGVLNITAENEGLDSELHLTISGGVINIVAGNDGINTNEDNVSVCAITGGEVNITVSGETGEGDGIDSNGWLVITGGKVNASACAFSGDAGIDSDMGIHITGGEVVAGGNMLDAIAGGGAPYAVFQFASRMKGGEALTLRNEAGETIGEYAPVNDYATLIISGENLTPGKYTLWQGETQLAGSPDEMRGMGPAGGFGGGRGNGFAPGAADGMTPPELPEGFDPEKMEEMTPPDMPQGMEPPQGFAPGAADDMTPGKDFGRRQGKEDREEATRRGGNGFGRGFERERGAGGNAAAVTVFEIGADGAVFSGVAAVQE